MITIVISIVIGYYVIICLDFLIKNIIVNPGKKIINEVKKIHKAIIKNRIRESK